MTPHYHLLSIIVPAPVPVVRAAGVQLALVVDDVTKGDVVIAYRVRHAPFAIASCVAGALLCAILLVRCRPRAEGDRP